VSFFLKRKEQLVLRDSCLFNIDHKNKSRLCFKMPLLCHNFLCLNTVSNLSVHQNEQGFCENADLETAGLGVGCRLCISNSLLGHPAGAAVPGSGQ
jgi:hypothetical protein